LFDKRAYSEIEVETSKAKNQNLCKMNLKKKKSSGENFECLEIFVFLTKGDMFWRNSSLKYNEESIHTHN
jgi:hypothetical protein